MSNKKGFTLAEVLAVVIVLGILASITYPIVKNIIEVNRKRGFASSLDGIIRTAKMYISDNAITTDTIIGYNDEKIKTENNNFVSGIVSYEDGQINLKGFSDGQYCGNGSADNLLIEERECTAEENVAVPVDGCFEFDTSTGTITRYNYTNVECPLSVIIPERINGVTVKHIGEHAFIRGVNLANYIIIGSKDYDGRTIYDIIENIDVTKYKEEIKLVPIPEPEKNCYYSSTQFNETDLTYIIGENDFYNYCDINYEDLSDYIDYRGIESIDLSHAKDLRTIGAYAFANGNLRYIKFGELPKLESIERYAFKNCSLAGTIDMSGLTNLNYIKNDAFMGNNINEVILPTGLSQIGEYAFMSNWLEEVDLSRTSLIFIGNNAFRNNRIDTIVLPNSLTTLSDGAFRKNVIANLTIGSGLSTIPQYAFEENNINNLVIPNTVQSIGYYAFSMAIKTNSTVTIGSGITSNGINASAFQCSSASACTYTININKSSGSVSGANWGNTYATVKWAGSF